MFSVKTYQRARGYWRAKKRLAERQYDLDEERRAFLAGYSDGFYRHARCQTVWPNAYCAGYWEGFGDSPFR